MAEPFVQSNFAAGELTPALYGHVDFAKFMIGAATMRNMFVNYRGGAYSRAGFRFIGYSKQIQNQYASGYITWSVNPSNGDTITLNGLVWTFVSGSPAAHQTQIGGTLAFTLAVLTNNLNDATDPELVVASYEQTASEVVTITYATPGAIGNSYTLAASAATPSGATLTGGTDSGPRLIPFQFNLNQGLVLEFGQQYMRVISDGAFVSDLVLVITGATNADPCVLSVASTAALTSGDWVVVADMSGMLELNGQQFVITVLSGTTFSLQDVFGNNIDSTNFGTWTADGQIARIYEISTPYLADDLKFLKYTQSADVMSLCLRNQETGVEYPPYELSRLADDSWTLTEFSTAATIDPPTGGTGYPTNTGTATTGLTGLTDFQYVVTAIDRDTGEESVASDIIDVPNSVNIALTAGAINLSWDGVNGARYYNVYKAQPAFRSTVPVGSLFGYAASTFGAAWVDNNVVPDFTQVPPLHKNPFSPGQCLAVDVLTTGSGVVDLTWSITTVAGTGADGYGVMVNGAMQAFVFTNGGENYADGDTIEFQDSTGVKASGTLTFTGNPAAGSTVTLNGTVWTFVAGSPAANQTQIQGTAQATAHVLAVNLTDSADTEVSKCTWTENVLAVDVEFKQTGTVGNAYTLAASGTSNITPSGATLSGGSGGTPPTGTLIVGPETGTYPGTVAYFQQRRVYANTANNPDTYWLSQPGAFSNFDSRIPTIDTDAIIGSPWSQQVDGIQFMLPMIGGLLVLTGQAAYQVNGAGGSPSSPVPLTPSSQQAVPQAYNGCHYHVPPVTIDYDVYYLQAKGAIIRSLSYNFWVNVLTGVDVTYLSSHLFSYATIEAMAWCEEPFKVMWCVRGEGVLLSLTSVKTQEVMGWARHDTNGKFISACSIIEPPTDALYVATQRFFADGTTPFMIERMDDRNWPTAESCWCVDAGVSTSLNYMDGQLSISSANGLGQPVDVDNLVGGQNYAPSTTVTVVDPTGDGQCVVTPTFSTPSGGSITALAFSGGSGYTQPRLVFDDPTRAGSGASGDVVLDNTATFTSTAGVFGAGNVGDVIRAGSGIAVVTAFTDANTVEAAIVQPVVDEIPNSGGQLAPVRSGGWSMDTPFSTVYGLRHLAGMEVTGLADGNVITPRTVSADGTITLDDEASFVIVGLGFQCQLQSLYLAGGSPTEQGRRKSVPAVTVRLQASGSIETGSNQKDGAAQTPLVIQENWVNMKTASVDQPNLAAPYYGDAVIQGTTFVRPPQLYTGDIRAIIAGGTDKRGQVAVQQSLPLPMNVLAFVREVAEGDIPETEGKAKARG